MGRRSRRRPPFSFWTGQSRAPFAVDESNNNDSIASLSASPGALSPSHHPATSSGCCCYGTLASISAWMLEHERQRCALDVHESYNNQSRYYRPVEVASGVERLVRRCEASLGALHSVLAARRRQGSTHKQDDDMSDDSDEDIESDSEEDRQQRSRGLAGLWLLLSATNVETECLTALLHLSAALDAPLAWAGLVGAGIELENGEDDDDNGYEYEPESLLYQWLIQEASINGGVNTLELLLQNAPALNVIRRREGTDIGASFEANGSGTLGARESHPHRSVESTIPFRPCRMPRVAVVQFLELIASTMQQLHELGTEHSCETGSANRSHETTACSSGWDDSSTSNTVDAAAADVLLQSPSFGSASFASLASLSSSFEISASRLHKMVTMDEWVDCTRQIEALNGDEACDDAVERRCAELLLHHSLARRGQFQSPSMMITVSGDDVTYARQLTCRLLSPSCGSSPLHWASYKGHTTCAQLLLAHGANPNAVAVPTGWTPVHDAAYSNSTQVLQVLIDAGANVNARAASGATPLCFACQENAVEATQLLLTNGADVVSAPAEANVAVRAPVRSGFAGGPSMMPSVLPPPFGGLMSTSPPPPALAGYTPLHYCARFNSVGAARVLLEHCRNNNDSSLLTNLLDAADSYGRRPLDIACLRASVDVLRELLHYGATIGRSVGTRRSFVANFLSARPVPFDQGTDPRTVSELRSLIPLEPVVAPKPWNCLTQESIDGCHELLCRADEGWSSKNHELFTPSDRAAADCIVQIVTPYMEKEMGVYRELWPLVMSYCGRGWFVPS